MKKIAITQRLIENNSYYEIREALDINYCKFVQACGFLPIVLSYEVDFKKYFDEIKIDGVMLTGGNDLNSINPNDLSKKRDDFEKEILEYCISEDIPILGICRGMQLIAEYFGSHLIKVENEVNTRSKLLVNETSKYVKELKEIKEINSFHNFAIENLSNDFIVSAKNNVNIIKAIEHKNKKIFAQMWHSEREKKFKNEEISLIRNFYGSV
jgi:putative glutamine amidotransferase